MNSFAQNINHIAGLDNTYGSKVELYKNNLSLKNIEHDIELKFSYYNNYDKKIHSIIHSEPGVLAGGINDVLLAFKSIVESSPSGSEFTCTVSSSVQNFVVNNVVIVSIAIDSNNDTYKAYELELKVTTAGAVTYDLFGEVSDTLKILPSLAMITSSHINAIANAYEIQDEIVNVSNNIASVIAVCDSISNVNITGTNIDNVNIVGGDIVNVNTVSTDISNVNTVSQSITNVNTVSSNIVDVGIASTNISSINTVANVKNISDIIRVADDLNSLDVNGIADITIVANDLVLGVDSNIITVSEAISNVNTTGNNIDNVNAVGTNIIDVGKVSTNIANVNITATDIASVNSVGSNIADVNIVSDGISNVNIVSSSIANVNTVATNITGLNTIVSNIAEILQADDNAAIATTKALEASDSAVIASTKATESLNSSIGASASASTATVKATEAISSALEAVTARDAILNMQVGTGVPGSEVIWDGTTLTVPAGTDGYSVTSITSNKVGSTTTITIDGNFSNAPYEFNVLDGVDGTGAGDMIKATYDTNNSGVVDNAEKVNGLTVETSVPVGALFTDTIVDAYTKTETQTVLPKIGFDTSNVITPGVGQLAWNADEVTMDLGVGTAVIQVGQELLIRIRNGSGSTITNGTVVMAIGSIGNSGRIVVAPHDGTKANADRVVGIMTEDLGNGFDGFATIIGKVRSIDTTGATVGETWVDGTKLYVKPNDNGRLTMVEPIDSEVKMVVAYVVKAHTSGTLYVRVTGVDANELKEWVNTQIAGKADESELVALNVFRADKVLATKDVAKLLYSGGNLVKIRYGTDADVDYEVLTYSGADLVNIAHYIGGVFKGDTVLTYGGGELVSSIFVGV